MTLRGSSPGGAVGPVDPDTGLYNVIVETPAGSRNKFDHDARTGMFAYGKTLADGAAFPFAFGYLPGTVGDDGDPLDIIVLIEAPAFPGCLVPARLVGVIEAEQTERDGETTRNDRLIAVADRSNEYGSARTLEDLPRGTLEEIERFFESYNRADGKGFRVLRRAGPEQARELVARASNERGGPPER